MSFSSQYKFASLGTGEQTSLYVELQAIRVSDQKLLTAYRSNRRFIENLPQFYLLNNEIQILGSLQHINIQEYVDTIFDGEQMFLLLGFQCHSFKTVFLGDHYLFEQDAQFIFKHLFEAIAYLHENGIAHRNICPDSIFFNEYGTIKLGYFFHAIHLDEKDQCSGIGGTLNYQAPEVLSEVIYNGKKADVWSAGVVLLSMMIKNNYFDGNDSQTIIKQIKTKPISYPNYFSSDLIEVLNMMLQRDPTQRASIHKILGCKWFQNVPENLSII